MNEEKTEQPDPRTRRGMKSQAGSDRWTQGCRSYLFVCLTSLNKVYTKGTGSEEKRAHQHNSVGGAVGRAEERQIWEI